MSIKIAVVGPTRRQGETTLALMLALTIQKVFKVRVCLTQTGIDCQSLKTFLGIKDTFDYTKSLSQLVRLLEAGDLADREISDYLTPIVDGVDLLQTSDSITSADVSSRLLLESIDYLNHNFIVTDVNTDLDSDVTQEILKKADLVVVSLTQGKDAIVKMRSWQEHVMFPDPNKVVYVVNYYDPVICALRDVSNQIGVRHVRVAKLNYNPFVAKMSNTGKFTDLIPYIFNKDSRVIDLLLDMQEILYMMSAQLGMAMNWPGEKNVS